MPKLTIEQVRAKFESFGYKLLTQEYLNCKQRLEFICPQQHQHSINFFSFQEGQRCGKCARNIRFEINEVRLFFKVEGYELLTEQYINCSQKLEFICPQGHRRSTTLGNFRQGRRCAKCVGKAKYNIDEVKEKFEAEGYTLLTKEYVNQSQHLEFICPEGHQHSTAFNNFLSGYRCGKCFKLAPYTLNEVREKFKAEGYDLLSNEYKNAKQPLLFTCPKGHQHSITFDCFLRGNRCGRCAGTFKYSLDEVRLRFAAEGYKLLSDKYSNSHTRLSFICPNEHRHSICFDSFLQGNRCGKCKKEFFRGKKHPLYDSSITEKERITKRKYQEYFDWRRAVFERDKYTCTLCGTGGKIAAHHLEGYRANPSLRVDVDNGVTLCFKHHIEFHHKFGRNNSTKMQFEQFQKDFEKD